MDRSLLFSGLTLLLTLGALAEPEVCDPDMVGFEIVTGYVYSSPKDLLDSIPGTLMLTDCLEACQGNESCRSVNYETGLCVLFSTTSDMNPESLSSSQFPVFTIYAQKSCLAVKPCERAWCFDRVPGYMLKGYTKATHQASSRQDCLELCLGEREFPCRSANYNNASGECALSDMDRVTLGGSGAFQRAGPEKKKRQDDESELELDMEYDYLENNCVDEPSKMCDFRRIGGRILKTVDAVYQDVQTLEECRELCLAAPFKCRSYDFGDTGENVCRLSHHTRATLGGSVGEPYLMVPEASTYELSSCYNVTVECRSSGMVAKIQTTKLFNGKVCQAAFRNVARGEAKSAVAQLVYVKGSPNSCARDVSRSLEFELRMPFNDVDCNVKREGLGKYANALVIQHHPSIVTSSDLGLSLSCSYDLSNMTVANELDLKVADMEPGEGPGMFHEVTVDSPSVVMRITERVTSEEFDSEMLRDPNKPEADMPVNAGLPEARVGDPLSLQFVIMDPDSPYEIFVRDLVAMDGTDGAEIQLIDERGCPTDSFIMGPLNKFGKILKANFDAFKFPSSETVQFRALVTPCMPHCEPVICETEDDPQVRSYGRRRRRRNSESNHLDDLLVVQSIHISDTFEFDRQTANKTLLSTSTEKTAILGGVCTNMAGFLMAGAVFLLLQVVLLISYVILRYRRNGKCIEEQHSVSTDSLGKLYDTGYARRF